jgi:GTP-binding protein HflX
MTPVTIPPVLISDTVGFIKKLPHDLVASFRSTLEEARNARLLLYVVDASDPSFRSQLAVTREVLGSIGVDDTPSYVLLNKCDVLSSAEREERAREFPEAVLMSTRDSADVAALRDTILTFFEQGMIEEDVFVPYALQKVTGQLRARFRVLSEHFEDQGTVLRVRAHSGDLTAMKARLLM